MRLEFTLTMPKANSWNGRWSGADNNYRLYVTIKKGHTAYSTFLLFPVKSWIYNFGDGWVAKVTGRVMTVGESKKHSDGFCGYEWMVTSILRQDEITTSKD